MGRVAMSAHVDHKIRYNFEDATWKRFPQLISDHVTNK